MSSGFSEANLRRAMEESLKEKAKEEKAKRAFNANIRAAMEESLKPRFKAFTEAQLQRPLEIFIREAKKYKIEPAVYDAVMNGTAEPDGPFGRYSLQLKEINMAQELVDRRDQNILWFQDIIKWGGNPEPLSSHLDIFKDSPIESLDTLEKLNTVIGTVFETRLGSRKERTKSSGTVAKEMPQKKFDLLKNLFRLKSSGKDSDCLIHSFLTITSKNFQSLTVEDKDIVASNFRAHVYTKTPQYLSIKEKQLEKYSKILTYITPIRRDRNTYIFNNLPEEGLTAEQIALINKIKRAIGPQIFQEKLTDYLISERVKPGIFLIDEDVKNLVAFYRIVISIFEGRNGILTIFDEHDGDSKEMSYLMYNNGGHYEGVIVREGNRYEFTYPTENLKVLSEAMLDSNEAIIGPNEAMRYSAAMEAYRAAAPARLAEEAAAARAAEEAARRERVKKMMNFRLEQILPEREKIKAKIVAGQKGMYNKPLPLVVSRLRNAIRQSRKGGRRTLRRRRTRRT